MKNKAHDLATYTFSSGEQVLLDTNVWLYLFPAPSGKSSSFVTSYSSALKKMLTDGAYLALDALVLSEYLNCYCRIEWKALYKTKYKEFKDFRQSSDYASVGTGAALFARKILKLCTCHDHPFSSSDVAKVLTDFEAGTCDFNDGLFVETCRQNGWKFVTNDGDFTDGGIEVLTSNPKLLSACP
ncbi:MAG: PIN domain-containing protein [Alphaproteobacteria bacterium]|uniref:PIN domain-containing protein n=1 Tax=Candidatus Nitrobium versatile TaxID=2884831 RepID=A0A953J7L2_9BACT|nr:PIN domain-containing protein [Candidatus Nitrobium versatile]